MYFPRGDGPLVSVIIPSRGNPNGLCATIDSFYSLAKDKSSVEFVLKIDDDDIETVKICEKIKQLIDVKVVISPRGRGWLDTHEWVNKLALQSKADWLFYAHDDVVLASGTEGTDVASGQNWDERLLHASFLEEATWHGSYDVCSLIVPVVGRPLDSNFFFLRRKVIELLGYWSFCPFPDRSIQATLCFISSSFRFPIHIIHKTDGVKDNNKLEAEKELNSLGSMRRRVEDVLKLVEHVKTWQKNKVIEPKHNAFEITF